MSWLAELLKADLPRRGTAIEAMDLMNRLGSRMTAPRPSSTWVFELESYGLPQGHDLLTAAAHEAAAHCDWIAA